MNLRMFATLALATLAGCDSPTFDTHRLVGLWRSDDLTYNVPDPAGQPHPSAGHIEIRFTNDGHYQRREVVFFMGRDLVLSNDEGTFSVRPGILRLASNHLAASSLAAAATPLPNISRGEYPFSMEGDVLFVSWCYAPALCIQPQPIRHLREAAFPTEP
jgi:hypothetical protein